MLWHARCNMRNIRATQTLNLGLVFRVKDIFQIKLSGFFATLCNFSLICSKECLGMNTPSIKI